MATYCFLGYWCIAGKITGFCTLACNKGLKIDFICTNRYKYTYREHFRKRSQSIWVETDVGLIIVSLSD